MKSLLSKALIFAAGAAIGSVATWKLIDSKYQELTKKEAEELREYYCGKYGKTEETDEEESEEEPINSESTEKPDIQAYAAMVLGQGYTNYAKGGIHEERVEEVNDMKRPYVISPDEFGETDYKTVSLTYYLDGVLTDSRGKVIRNVDDLVGIDSLNHFGEYEDDSVFVRNDARKTDYEILQDPKAYSEINTTAHSAEDE